MEPNSAEAYALMPLEMQAMQASQTPMMASTIVTIVEGDDGT